MLFHEHGHVRSRHDHGRYHFACRNDRPEFPVSGFGAQAFGTFSFGAPWTNPTTPNLSDFTSFVYENMGVSVAALPVTSPWLGYAFNQAVALVPLYPQVTAIEYVLAVYNCGGHLLLKQAPDQAGQTFFVSARKDMKLLEPQTGVVQSSGDESTSVSFAIGDGMKNMTMSDLDFYRTPYGREYLAFIQDGGPTIWGLS